MSPKPAHLLNMFFENLHRQHLLSYSKLYSIPNQNEMNTNDNAFYNWGAFWDVIKRNKLKRPELLL